MGDMLLELERGHAVAEFDCPVCDAVAGTGCKEVHVKTRVGRPRWVPHVERINLYRKKESRGGGKLPRRRALARRWSEMLNDPRPGLSTWLRTMDALEDEIRAELGIPTLKDDSPPPKPPCPECSGSGWVTKGMVTKACACVSHGRSTCPYCGQEDPDFREGRCQSCGEPSK